MGRGGVGAHCALDPSPPSSPRDPRGSDHGHRARGRVARAGKEMLQGGAIRPHAAHLGPRPLVPPFSLFAEPDCPPCLRPLPGAARPGSARPRRPSCSARSACAAAAAAAAPSPLARPPRSRAPGTPFRPRTPLPASCSAGPGAATHRVTACDTQVHSRGARGNVTHSHTLSRGHAFPHCQTHGVTYSVTDIIHIHILTQCHLLI